MKEYLEALARDRPRRRSARASLERRLETVRRQVSSSDPVERVQLLQEQMDLEAELASSEDVVDIQALEDAFVAAAKAYSEHRGISYRAWREVGVDADLLRRAGIRRTMP